MHHCLQKATAMFPTGRRRQQSSAFHRCLLGPVSDHVLMNRASKERALHQVIKGQLKRRDKLTSIARFWSPENSFEGIFEKIRFSYVEIWAAEIFALLIWKVSEKGRENMRSIPRVTLKGAMTSNTIFGFFACKVYQRQRDVLCARWSLEFFKFDLNMDSLNNDSSQKDILDDGINILSRNVEQNDVCPYMSDLTNATMNGLHW